MSGPEVEDDALVGTTVAGKYRIDRVIGRGGMGAVYQATNTAIGKRVALKFLDKESARDLDSVARFQREAEAASAVESAHIVQIFDSGTGEGDRPFLVMELLSGEDLRARLKRDGRVPLAEVVHISGQVLRALSRAHAAGIVHRDLKPDNIFLCHRDDDPMFVKIVDFGISKVQKKNLTADTLTRRGVVLGTAFYMSPEQAQAFRDIDGRTDLYSLGSIMYEALAGRPPHVGSAYEAVLIDICTKDADDIRKHAPDVPEAMAEVIAQALERDRAKRFQSAAEFYDALALAAPGLLRTGGPHSRDALLSNPESGERTAPIAPSITPPSTDQGKPAQFGTGEGTAVRPSSADVRTQTRRTVVIALVAALGAFAITAFLFPRGKTGDVDGARGAAPTASAEPASTAPTTPEPSAVDAGRAPVVAPANSASPAPSASAKKPLAKQPQPYVKPTAKPTGAPTGKQPPPTNTGVASGLQLETKGP